MRPIRPLAAKLLPLLLTLAGSLNAEVLVRPDIHQLGNLASGQLILESWAVNPGSSPATLRLAGAVGTHLSLNETDFVIQPGDSVLLEIQCDASTDMPLEEVLLFQAQDQAGWLMVEVDAAPYHEDWPGATGLSGQALVDYLNDEVSGHTVYDYTTARTYMYSAFDNVGGQVQCVYTGSWVTTSGIPDGSIMNCEHTWPQSMGAEGDARSDMHHLYPSMAVANSARSNYPFGNVVSQDWSQGGSLRGLDENGVTVFEPRDEHKGDAARALFYFALRYGNLYSFLSYQEATMRDWAFLDDVSQKELDRNDAIDALQHNRNPFIDHNDYLLRIGSLAGDPDPADSRWMELPTDTLKLGTISAGESLSLRFPLLNTGTQSLLIGYIQAEDEDLQVVSRPMILQPLELEWVELLWEPTSEGSFAGELLVSSNAMNGGLLSIPYTGQVEGVNDLPGQTALPASFSLGEAWPNPFNPVTHIRLVSPMAGDVRLEVLDLLGRRVLHETIALAAGESEHTINLNGEPSGLYLLHASMMGQRQTRKLLLAR